MSEWTMKKGNTAVQAIPIKDKNGTLITNLADAEEIKFVVKKKRDSDAVITKTKGDGIAVNTPETGYLQLTIIPSDTENVDSNYYLMALQITWSANEVYEVLLKIDGGEATENFRVTEDLIS